MTGKHEKYSIQNMIDVLNNTLISYLEMQYHIKDDSLIHERHQMLTHGKNIISRLPFIEATPVYEQSKSFQQADLPAIVRETLVKLSNLNIGIYSKPYHHQLEALQHFFNQNKDLIISTGTGSGKTESFLMPIIGKLAIEASQRPESAKIPGCRALLLYPLNALVNDQLGRLRKLFGNKDAAKLIAGNCGRYFRFGAYNSRTPYPGQRSSKKDLYHMKPLFEDYYENPEFLQRKDQLEKMGKWPSKDLSSFYAKDLETLVYKTGKRAGESFTKYHWKDRLKTQPDDRELLTRHEMHEICPDILITNYSMLEYMLMRPIEREIFQQTKNWLLSDTQNELVIVIDEAHTYRGTGGAEVALLIRRLQSRLGVSRNRIRFILTSASLGNKHDTIRFANALTGVSQESSETVFHVIVGKKEKMIPGKSATINEANALSSFNIETFLNYYIDSTAAIDSIKQLATQLNWSQQHMDQLHHYLFNQLFDFPPAQALMKKISQNPIEFGELATFLFPNTSASVREKATSTLLSLCTFARRKTDGKIFLPARLHLFYRGLPGLYACINPKCHCRLDQNGNSFILGRLYGIPKTNCDCGGRVFELISHQDCGSAFIRGYINDIRGDFLLHEPSNHVGREQSLELIEVHILVEPINQSSLENASKIFIDIKTGKIIRENVPKDDKNYLPAYIPNKAHPERIQGKMKLSFDRCPICHRGLTQSPFKMKSFTTKGEGPFANLVKAQILHQPPQKTESKHSPNAGRKTLLFSDGRQRAARLALFIPREVELDSFRQVICLAWQQMNQINRETRLTTDLYHAFVAVVSKYHLQFFDQSDQQDLRQHIQQFEEDYDSDLEDVFEDRWEITPPPGYYEALLRQLCHPFYSFQATTIGYVTPSKRAEKGLIKDLNALNINLSEQEYRNIILVWINELLKDYAFNKSISRINRNRAANFSKSWGHSGNFRLNMKKILRNDLIIDDSVITELQKIFCKRLCNEENELHFLDPSATTLHIDLKRSWFHCQNCAYISPVLVANQCPQCRSKNVNECHPNDSYIKARKRFFREPVFEALSGTHPRHISAEEHTAQLSQKDNGILYATTEKHELRFQDILLDDREGPIDVLSCTTTMEVGVDIGSLVAVGLRNVPPQRENYQQRAGRTGRRGTAVSTVITYAQGGPHDSYYFHHPERIIAGEIRKPVIDITNEKIVKRHVYAFLFQTFFHESIDKGNIKENKTSDLFSALGNAAEFFSDNTHDTLNLNNFQRWIDDRHTLPDNSFYHEILKWLPDIKLPAHLTHKEKWLEIIIQDLMTRLNQLKIYKEDTKLLDFLFDHNFLPTYSFPRDLVSFMVQKKKNNQIKIQEQPQRNIALALSEYAPGRLVVINKTVYRSGGITSDKASNKDTDQAEQLFSSTSLKKYVHCTICSYVQDTFTDDYISSNNKERCPICNGAVIESDMLIPERFHPEKGEAIEEYENDQEITYAGSAQFPVPVGEVNLGQWRRVGKQMKMIHTLDRRLVIVNTGKGFDMDGGFEICVKCGATVPMNSSLSLSKKHKRPYMLNRYESLCSGETRKVILGTTFLSDLLLIRIPIRKPLCTRMTSSIHRNALEDALRTLSETLLLSASRVMDVDPVEFKAGFRIVPNLEDHAIDGDIYLFDSLSGGAGYADQAGDQIDDIINMAKTILSQCPSNCERSCQDCLRHYGNQYWHDHLDRFLGLSLLNYAISGNLPQPGDINEQQKQLSGLRRLLVLDAYQCIETNSSPLSLIHSGKQIDFSVCPALMENDVDHQSASINLYFLQRNLPGSFQMVKHLIENN